MNGKDLAVAMAAVAMAAMIARLAKAPETRTLEQELTRDLSLVLFIAGLFLCVGFIVGRGFGWIPVS
jgi:Na+/H+ antiporter NhaD/arsenite permease-like protein